ncbi:protein AF-10 isoform X2 [Callorhinchus milii]|uniref:protein AF-10 isoform X2 n=1 Tax=Callorhinchus milii TaxID=7868 RepID=UPI0004572299|nr:protein AF-10 isoform X2 [Callorhinchus milii]|eukprot:gi/632945210/ref/XP_007887926.1/ PREDICTED: protein AF-10 isoform X2 [Callorhinchus milii]
MVSSGLPADFSNMKEMIGGCCVCSDERGWAENPLVYCDGHGCNVAVHQACYGIVQVPTGPWFCRKCESQERAARVKCELCPHKDGALKRTDNGGWAHVVCALYIPEVQFANVTTMEPIVLQYVPHERFNKTCYICEEQGRESKAATGACMTCNKHGCRQAFHVTCAQLAGLLCEEEGSEADNVKYCGYCKYHFSKLKQKDRDKFRQKPKKSLDSSSTVPSLTVTTEKTYTSPSSSFMPGSLKRLEETTARFTNVNFQEVSARPSSGNEGSEVKVLEVKGKKTGGHSSGQRGRKPGNGKNSACGPATGSPNSFPQGSLLGTASSVKSPSGSSVQSPQEFQSFTESDLRNDTCVHPQPSSTRETIKGEIVEQEGTLINISPLLNLPSTSSGLSQTNIENSKHSENSHGDYGVSDATAITSSGAPGFKRAQASIMEEETIKEKKRKGSKKYKHGPGRPKGSKNKESISQHSVSSASPSSSSVTSAAGSVASANLQKSPSLLRNGSLQNLSVSSSPAGSGIYTSNELPVSLQNAAPGTSCSTPISGSILPTQNTTHSQQMNASPVATVSASTTVTATQANALPGTSFNLAPSHMFGNRLNPNSAMAALIAQSETNQADQELVDTNRGLPGRSISPRASLSPRSPAGGLQIRYDPSSNNILENLPPVASSIEQLLERQWSEGQQFLVEQGTPGDVMGMLKSLHQLQVENRRLEEQIKNLTAKKERLQLLNAQLSVPFPVTSSTVSPAAQMHTFSSQAVPNPASLHSNKGSHLSNSFLPESSLPVPSQELTSSGQSTSSSSLASPTPIGQSPAQQGSGLIAVQKINSVTGALASGLQTVTSTIPTMSSVGGLMGTLSGNQMAVNGIVGALNGVIQTSESITPSTLSHTAVPPNLTLPLSTSLNSLPGLGLLSEQQRQLLLHQQQQQLQQLLPAQQLTPEQHQALFYQLMQQQHHQHQHELQQLQIPGTAQIPLNNLLANTQAQPIHSAPPNPYIAIHSEATTPKVARLNDKGGPGTQEKS